MPGRSHIGARRGQIIIAFACALFALALAAVFAVDLGGLVLSHAKLRNASDAAALGAVQELWAQRAAGVSESDARAAAEAEARAIVELNHSGAGTQVAFGVWDDQQFSAVGLGVPVNAVRVTSARDQSAPAGPEPRFFAGLFGLSSVEHAARGTARFKPAGLIPFAVWEDELGSPGDVLVMYNDQEVAPGAFGLLDFDGGDNSAADLKYWTRYGFPGSLYIDPAVGHRTIEGSTGLKTSLQQAIRYHISTGDPVTVCIYRSISGQASATQFEVVGFASLVIEGHTFEDETEEEYESITARLVSTYFVGTGATDGPMRGLMALQLVQ